ncbi:MAG: amidohydrolase family protein [Chloroflexota bacterium]
MRSTERDQAALDTIPLIDHHSHPWLRDWQQQDATAFRACFSESPSRHLIETNVPWSLPYQRSLRQLAALLGCDPTEEAILGVRRTSRPAAYLARLFPAANIAALLLDNGFPPPASALSAADVAAATGPPMQRILRIEAFVEELTCTTNDFAELVDRFDTVVGNLAAGGAAALKSIAAYRSGLRLAPVTLAVAAGAWLPLRATAQATGKVRIAAKPVIDFFALRALRHAARQGLVVQFHTGYGDPDLDLREATPLHLRPVLEDPAYRDAVFVLLHGAYPYTREAAYLAAVYPQVYLDVSTSLPPLGSAEIEAMLSQALAVAPVSKVLLSSDGARIPEHHVLGALNARRALGVVLQRAVQAGDIAAADAPLLAAWPLHRTAATIYGALGAIMARAATGAC